MPLGPRSPGRGRSIPGDLFGAYFSRGQCEDRIGSVGDRSLARPDCCDTAVSAPNQSKGSGARIHSKYPHSAPSAPEYSLHSRRRGLGVYSSGSCSGGTSTPYCKQRKDKQTNKPKTHKQTNKRPNAVLYSAKTILFPSDASNPNQKRPTRSTCAVEGIALAHPAPTSAPGLTGLTPRPHRHRD